MKKIISNLEKNVFCGIEIKKGLNKLNDKDFKKLFEDKLFLNFHKKGLIKIIETKKPLIKADKPKNADNKTQNKLTYNEMLQFVKENNITVKSNRKKDLIEAIEKFKKGE